MEHTPDERRFERIEATLETLAKAVTAIATDSHKSFENINNTQRHVLKELQHVIDRTTKTEESLTYLFNVVGKIGDGTKALLTAQVLMVDAQTKADERIAILADAQAKSELAQAETQGKLGALIDMWDRSIRERGPNNGPPQPPPAA